jgi:enamine deaminase RidA (YjgF/YER057c/UK114 family)
MRLLSLVPLLSASVPFLAGFGVPGAPLAGQSQPQPDLSSAPYRQVVASGDFMYVAGTIATDARRHFVPGDVRAQTRTVLEEIKRLLQETGGSLDRVASVQVYLRRAGDFQAMNEVYRTYFPKDPPARTTVVANLVLPQALVEMSAIALRPGAERTVVHPADWIRAPNPYSYGIKSGETLFLSGLVPRNGRDNTAIEGDMTVQVKAVLDNAGAILKAAGMGYADVVSARVFITDTGKLQEMNAAYRPCFPAEPPARATVKVGLTSPQYLVEIGLTAVKSSDRRAFTTPNADGTPGRPNPVLSSAIRAGNRLYLAGTLGNTDANKSDIAGQTKEALARLGRTLAAAGFEWRDAVDTLVCLTDVRNAGAMNGAYRSVVPQPFPARATIETGLVAPDGLVEIMVVAAK